MLKRIAHVTTVTGLGLAVAMILAGCGSKAEEAASDKVEAPEESQAPQPEAHAGHKHEAEEGKKKPAATKTESHESQEGHKHEAKEPHEEHGKKPAADTTAQKADAYPLDVCVVSGEKLGSMGEVVTIQHEGRTVKLCCKGCVAMFKKEPAKYLAKLDKGTAAKKAGGHEGHQH